MSDWNLKEIDLKLIKKDLLIKERNSKLSDLTDDELLAVLAFSCNGVLLTHTNKALEAEINTRGMNCQEFIYAYRKQLNQIQKFSYGSKDYVAKKSFAHFIFQDCCGWAIGLIAQDVFEKVYNEPYYHYL